MELLAALTQQTAGLGEEVQVGPRHRSPSGGYNQLEADPPSEIMSHSQVRSSADFAARPYDISQDLGVDDPF